MTILYSDPLFLKHETGPHHPERKDRLRVIVEQIEKAGLAQQCKRGAYQPLTAEAVAHIHSPAMVQRVQQVCAQGGGHVDADTVASADSFAVALAAAGACAAAVDAVVKGPDCNAL